MSLAKKIDELINKQYATMTQSSPKGELAQLSRLFSKGFADGLAKIIYQDPSDSPKTVKTITVEMNYIDKQPYARYLDDKNILVHGELGDALFIFKDGWGSLDETGKIIPYGSTNDRALFFQAKANNSNNTPIVPIGTGKSTEKELKLLSQWQSFDLVKKPQNKIALINSVNVHKRDKNILSYGWFGACAPTHKQVWESRWMCGEAKTGVPCLTTLGMLLASLYQCEEINGIEIGRHFDSQKEIVDQKSEWDDLINSVVKLSKESKSTTVLASYSSTRHRSSTIQLNLDEIDDKIKNDLAEFIFHYLNANRYFHYEAELWMYFELYSRMARRESCIKEKLKFHRFLIDITEWVFDELESKNTSTTFSDVVSLVEKYIRTPTLDALDNEVYNSTTSDHTLNHNKNGMFILTVTVLRAEG